MYRAEKATEKVFYKFNTELGPSPLSQNKQKKYENLFMETYFRKKKLFDFANITKEAQAGCAEGSRHPQLLRQL